MRNELLNIEVWNDNSPLPDKLIGRTTFAVRDMLPLADTNKPMSIRKSLSRPKQGAKGRIFLNVTCERTPVDLRDHRGFQAIIRGADLRVTMSNFVADIVKSRSDAICDGRLGIRAQLVNLSDGRKPFSKMSLLEKPPYSLDGSPV